MIYFKCTNDLFFNLTADFCLNFLNNLSYVENSDLNIENEDILIIKNYFEDKISYFYVEKWIKESDMYIVYLPRTLKNKESYAFITKNKFIYNKLYKYIKLFKSKVTAIYDFPNYWDCQWKMTIMCERMCEKMMNDSCVQLFNTTILPYDFIGTVHLQPRLENLLSIQKTLDFSDKIVCSESVTKILKKMEVKIDPEKIILHPHVWGTSTRYSMEEIEKEYGFKIPFKNMCYMSNVQEFQKKENSFIGFYISHNENLPQKDKEIILWGKEMDLVLGKSEVDKKLKLIDKLCENFKVYVTAENERGAHIGHFDRIKNLLINKNNFFNYGILNREDYLEKLKEFKIFMSLNENVSESLGFVEALSSGCYIISHKGFHTSITESDDNDLKNYYSIYNSVDEIEDITNTVLIKNVYKSKILDVFDKFSYINRIINIINGQHETTGVKYY